MKIYFEDDSFIHLDESPNNNKIVSITMSGLSADGKKLTMSSSELDLAEVQEISDFFQNMIKKFS